MNNLTVESFLAREQDELIRTELQEGCLVVLPRWSVVHQYATLSLCTQLHEQRSKGHLALMGMHVDLELASPDEPGTVRRPDGILLSGQGLDRAVADGTFIKGSDVHLVVEVLSPGQSRTDLLLKRHDYADAGIPQYWVIELEPRVSMRAFRRTATGRYADVEVVTGTFTTEEPFKLSIDLDALVLTD